MRTPRDVVVELLTGVCESRWSDLPALYAEDALVEHPFARDASRRLIGRDALHAHFGGFAAAGYHLKARDLLIHEGADPEVVVAEFVYDITTADGVLAMAACFVWRVRDGLIVHSRDYLDQPQPVTSAF